jgi:DnaJ-class molecular chaperone
MAPAQQRQAPHVVLGIDRDAPMSEYRQAYLKQARRWHPDKISATATPEENAEAHRRFHAIQEAWEEMEETRGKGRDSMFGDLPPVRSEDPEKLRADIANLRECLAFAEEQVTLLHTAAGMFADMAPTPPTSASKKGGKGRGSKKSIKNGCWHRHH